MDQEKSKICRACLTEDGEFQSLFIPQEAGGKNIRLSEILRTFASIQITLNDGLTEVICEECASNALNLYLFKLQLQESDAILRKKETEIIKKEIHTDQETVKEPINQINSDDLVLVKPEIFDESDDSLNFIQHEFKTEYEEIIETQHMVVGEHEIKNEDNSTPEAPALVPIYTEKATQKVPSVSSLKPLLALSHTLPNALQCHICQTVFKESKKLIQHLKDHIVATCRCSICKKYFQSPNTLLAHLRTHSGVKPFKCEICGKGYNSWNGVRMHKKTHKL